MEEEKKNNTKPPQKKEEKPTKKEETNTTKTKKATEAKKEENKKETKRPEEAKKEENKKETKKPDEAKKETKKKFDKPEDKKKKTNKGVVVASVIAILAIVVIICFIVFTANSPKNVVEKMFKEIETGNYSGEILSNLLQQESFNQEAQSLLFDKLDHKIVKVEENGDTATVEVEITNKDFKTIMNNYMQKVIKLAFGGQQPNEEEMTNYLIEELKNEGVQTVTVTQSIALQKQDGKWVLSEENDFAGILLPGFNEAINALN